MKNCRCKLNINGKKYVNRYVISFIIYKLHERQNEPRRLKNNSNLHSVIRLFSEACERLERANFLMVTMTAELVESPENPAN